MTSTENITSLPNFKLEKVIKSPQELRESGYDGFGAVVVIVNEFRQILMVQESNNKVGDEKKHQWGPIYETGNLHDLDAEMTMLSGVASELGFETLHKLKRDNSHTYGYDFKRSPSDSPSRSLITVCYLATQEAPKQNEWGHEINDLKWMTLDEVLALPDSQLRLNAKAILNELSKLNALNVNFENMTPITVPTTINQEFLALRDPKLDIHWTRS